MTKTTEAVRGSSSDDTGTRLERARALRDHIRVQVHLGHLEMKDEWARLEQRLFDAEQAAEHATADSRAAVGRVLFDLEQFLTSLARSIPGGT